MYDLIGDIHGHADELKRLLSKLGYEVLNGYYQHPDRKVIFVGDFIDRGSQILEVLEIVRPMIEKGSALSVMGNHEFNAIAFHTKHPVTGEPLREHSDKNIKQHQATLDQLGDSINEYVEWFKTLPFFLDLPELRVVHACWDEAHIKKLRQISKDKIDLDFLVSATTEDGEFCQVIEETLKGKEIHLPEGLRFKDKDNNERSEIRIRWYENLTGKTYYQASLPHNKQAPDITIADSILENSIPYPAHEKPIFFGHYWLKEDVPELLAENVCCLDYSVAKGGYLVGYRFEGEGLSGERFIRS